ncbi:hypothetical protein D027_1579A, partial [Vibrio parahaemolyticus 861]
MLVTDRTAFIGQLSTTFKTIFFI